MEFLIWFVGALITAGVVVYFEASTEGKLSKEAIWAIVPFSIVWPLFIVGMAIAWPLRLVYQKGVAKYQAKLDKEEQIKKGLEILKQEEQEQETLFAIAEKKPLPMPKERVHRASCRCRVCQGLVWEDEDDF